MTAGTQLAKVPQDKDGVKALVQRMAPQIQALGGKYITPQAVLALTLDAAGKNPQLLECTNASLMRSLVKVSRLGLVIGEDVHLVPVKDSSRGLQCEAWLDYRGMKKLLKRAGIIRDMREAPVYQHDKFEMELGLEERLVHIPKFPGDRGKLVGAYSIIQLPHGRKTFHFMSLDEIEAVRRGSRQWSPAKVAECPPWWAMKCVVRDWAARQPLSADLKLALQADDTAEERPDGVTEDGVIEDVEFSVEDAAPTEGA